MAVISATLITGTLGLVAGTSADASINNLSVPTQATNPVAPGSTTAYTPITAGDSSSSTSHWATLSVPGSGTGSLPSGATFSDSGDGVCP